MLKEGCTIICNGDHGDNGCFVVKVAAGADGGDNSGEVKMIVRVIKSDGR